MPRNVALRFLGGSGETASETRHDASMGPFEKEIRGQIHDALETRQGESTDVRLAEGLRAVANSVIRLAAEMDALRASRGESDAPPSDG
jgi:hypothetical protein